MSQMTVSQMTLTSAGESHQHRLHYLAEHVFNWSGVPVVHIRPTAFLDNPMFTLFAAPSLRERNVLALRFGTGRTAPIATGDVARTVATVLVDPGHRIGDIFELTGPASLDIDRLAQHLATMALLHRAGRYDRATDDVEKITGQPPSTVGQYIAEHTEMFS